MADKAITSEQVRIITIEGPVEKVNGKLLLRIPLELGGAELHEFAEEIATIEGEFLVVEILPWLAKALRVKEGSLVEVDNLNGKFTITRSAKNDR